MGRETSGVCREKYKKLLIALEKAKDHGYLNIDATFVEYDYEKYMPKQINKSWIGWIQRPVYFQSFLLQSISSSNLLWTTLGMSPLGIDCDVEFGRRDELFWNVYRQKKEYSY